MGVIEQAIFIDEGNGWFEARHPVTNRLILRINPSQMMIENVHRNGTVLIDLLDKKLGIDVDRGK